MGWIIPHSRATLRAVRMLSPVTITVRIWALEKIFYFKMIKKKSMFRFPQQEIKRILSVNRSILFSSQFESLTSNIHFPKICVWNKVLQNPQPNSAQHSPNFIFGKKHRNLFMLMVEGFWQQESKTDKAFKDFLLRILPVRYAKAI